MFGVIPSNFFKKTTSLISNRFPEVHKRGIHTHTHTLPSVRPSFRPSARPSVCPPVLPYVRPSIRPSGRPSVRPSDHTLVRPSVRCPSRHSREMQDACQSTPDTMQYHTRMPVCRGDCLNETCIKASDAGSTLVNTHTYTHARARTHAHTQTQTNTLYDSIRRCISPKNHSEICHQSHWKETTWNEKYSYWLGLTFFPNVMTSGFFYFTRWFNNYKKNIYYFVIVLLLSTSLLSFLNSCCNYIAFIYFVTIDLFHILIALVNLNYLLLKYQLYLIVLEVLHCWSFDCTNLINR